MFLARKASNLADWKIFKSYQRFDVGGPFISGFFVSGFSRGTISRVRFFLGHTLVPGQVNRGSPIDAYIC